eukprot:COSAG05_NODE_21_length_32397_cov_125.224008_7_plen_106_part_00
MEDDAIVVGVLALLVRNDGNPDQALNLASLLTLDDALVVLPLLRRLTGSRHEQCVALQVRLGGVIISIQSNFAWTLAGGRHVMMSLEVAQLLLHTCALSFSVLAF